MGNITLRKHSGVVLGGDRVRIPMAIMRSVAVVELSSLSIALYKQGEMVQPPTELPNQITCDFDGNYFDCVEIINITEGELSYEFVVSSGRLGFFKRGSENVSPVTFGVDATLSPVYIGYDNVENYEFTDPTKKVRFTFDGSFGIYSLCAVVVFSDGTIMGLTYISGYNKVIEAQFIEGLDYDNIEYAFNGTCKVELIDVSE